MDKPIESVADRDERIVAALEKIADRLDQLLNLAIELAPGCFDADELRTPPTKD